MEGMKTLDIRSYRETIKAAVAHERQADPNWSWGIRSITKGVARIGWGYLDYIGEKEAFTVEVLQDEENGKVAVLGVIPNGSKVWRFVGPNHWEDGPTIEGWHRLRDPRNGPAAPIKPTKPKRPTLGRPTGDRLPALMMAGGKGF